MNRTERISALHRLLSAHRRGLTVDRLAQELGCSTVTVRRDLYFMRDAQNAPLVLEGDPELRWRYAQGAGDGVFHLPGVWLDAEELYALLFALQLVQRRGPDGADAGAGMLKQALGPLQSRLDRLFGDRIQRLERLSVLRTQARRSNQGTFRLVLQAMLSGRQLRFAYRARSSDQKEREWRMHPQRLVHHRDNWYLDAVVDPQKSKKAFRFAIDNLLRPELLDQPSIDLPLTELDTPGGSGYGIFAGPVVDDAILHFSPRAARWIADEEWHPKQKLRWLPEGGLELTVPFANPRELLMDVQRHGPEVEVIGPPALRAQMRELVLATAARYGAADEAAGVTHTPAAEPPSLPSQQGDPVPQ